MKFLLVALFCTLMPETTALCFTPEYVLARGSVSSVVHELVAALEYLSNLSEIIRQFIYASYSFK